MLLLGIVQTDGTVGDIVVLYSLDHDSGLDQAAVRAFRQWRFKPGTYMGKPAPVAVTFEMHFTLGRY